MSKPEFKSFSFQVTGPEMCVALAHYFRDRDKLPPGKYSFDLQINARNNCGVFVAVPIPKRVDNGIDIGKG